MLDFLISNAYAQSAPSGVEATLSTLGYLGLMFGIFYFILIRPQQKQARQHKEMVANLQRGDSVVTAGGIMAKVHRVDEEVVVLEIGEVEISPRTFRPMRVKVKKATVSGVTAKSVGGETEEKGEADSSR